MTILFIGFMLVIIANEIIMLKVLNVLSELKERKKK